MQTFLPYKSFSGSARCLDNKRLGKQRVEVLQILNTLTGKSTGWANHPATRMWRGYERALCAYGFAVCEEWYYDRGFRDTCWRKIYDIECLLDGIICNNSDLKLQSCTYPIIFNEKSDEEQTELINLTDIVFSTLLPGEKALLYSDKTVRAFYPPWLTDEFCLSHRSNLIRKNPDYYRPLWPDVPDNLPYIWPV